MHLSEKQDRSDRSDMQEEVTGGRRQEERHAGIGVTGVTLLTLKQQRKLEWQGDMLLTALLPLGQAS